MQAIILAAGMGKRLKKLTENNTKCMVKVNGISLIERMLRQLKCLALDRIVIVIGYKGKELKEYIDSLNVDMKIIYIENVDYDRTNNIYSLALAKDFLMEDDTLLLESDLIFEDSVLRLLLDDPRETLALVDKYESWMDGTCIKIGEDDSIETFVPGKKFKFEDIQDYYKTVNIYKFSKHFSRTHYVPFLEAYSKALGNNEYYEQVLRVITMLDDPEIKAKKLSGQIWYEIDDIQDLDIATSMFVPDDGERLESIQKRWGGYWRYPKLLNFCYPGNPFFPPERMIDELKANMSRLISEYPSGMRVNALIMAKNLGQTEQDVRVAVANGIEEIIQSIMNVTMGRVGCVLPTNEELINRCGTKRVVSFVPANEDLSYTADDLIAYFSNKEIELLVLCNPEYHTGNYIDKRNIIQILEWGMTNNIKIIVDESYCDFADEDNNSIVDHAILSKYNNVVVLKNISVTHGVPGLRLGCVVSLNEDWIQKIESNLSIWNINSLAEFYLQIEEKYNKDYKHSLDKLREVKKKFIQRLSDVPGLYPIPSQENYCLCKLKCDCTSKKLTEQLLIKYNILIKDMTERINNQGQYIKLAIRDEVDNEQLIKALTEILSACVSGRIVNKKTDIDVDATRRFFDERIQRKLPHRYNYVIYQDSNPELALERDRFEKSKIGPLLKINGQSKVLDIGCGVGRWGDEIVPQLTDGEYTGIDFSKELIQIARDHLRDSGKCQFYHGSFQEAGKILEAAGHTEFDVVLINGVLMYINDTDINKCLESVDRFVHKGSRIYIKESVGADKRLTLNDFYSKELNSQYNAIYRSLDEYNKLFDKAYLNRGYRMVRSEATWKHELENRKETLSWYWVIEKI